jgi:hypothetical protein
MTLGAPLQHVKLNHILINSSCNPRKHELKYTILQNMQGGKVNNKIH